MEQKLKEKVETFFSQFKEVRFGGHEIILKPGQPVPGIFYLRKGLVRQYFLTKKAEVLEVHVFRPGSFFLMVWAINDLPNKYYFEAITPVEVWKAPLREVTKFIKSEPELLYNFASRILKGLDGLIVRLGNLTYDSAYAKTASLLTYFVKRYGKKNGKGTVIDFPLTHREIANWIGTARETTSLQIEGLKRKGIISLDGRSIIVKDLKKLEREASATGL